MQCSYLLRVPKAEELCWNELDFVEKSSYRIHSQVENKLWQFEYIRIT